MDFGRSVLSVLCVAVSVMISQRPACLTRPSHDVAPKAQFEVTFNRVYTLLNGRHPSTRVNAQEIALVYIIIAQGTMYNIEMPAFDLSADRWLHLAELALVKGEFLSNNTIPGVQTLVSDRTLDFGQMLMPRST